MESIQRRIERLVRQFPENGMKLLLQNPQNTRDLLTLACRDLAARIDTDHLRFLPTTFIRRDYRHVESDLVLVAPYRSARRDQGRELLVYILIEHQSAPDRLMPLRLLDYLVQIYRLQTRRWAETHPSLAGVRLDPVLPIVFYTGTRRWDTIGQLADLMGVDREFRGLAPVITPVFVNLPALDPEVLVAEGGAFGWVLRVVQQRRTLPGPFRALLGHVVGQLETMVATDRLRWLELLSYLLALVYHEREPGERKSLQETIETSVSEDSYRKELSTMVKTIADELMEKGERRGIRKGKRKGERKGAKNAAIATRQQTLIRQLARRFGEIPESVSTQIQATRDLEQLDHWLDQFATAVSLNDIEFDDL